MSKVDFAMGCLFILFAVTFLLFATLGLIEIATQKFLGESEVECYDRYSNEILNQTCLKEVYSCGIITKKFGGCEYNLNLVNKTYEEIK